MKILFITSGQLPVPAVDGGAVETLLENYLIENEIIGDNLITVVSCQSKAAKQKATKYKKAQFVFVPYRFVDNIMDSLIFMWHTYITKNWKVMFLKNKWKKKRFEKYITDNIDFSRYDRVIVENNMSLLPAIRKKVGTENFRTKCYYHMHSVFIDNPSCIRELVECKSILTVSEFVKKQICLDNPELNASNIKVVKNGIDKNLFEKEDCNTRNEIRKSLSYSDKDIVFLYVGRISPEKGVLELVHAFKKLELANKKLLLVGCSYQGERRKSFYEIEIENKIKSLPEQIAKIGYVENDEVSKLYNMADIMVIPSVVGDAGPLNLLEAMAMGTMIVASDKGGIPEYSKGYNKMFYVTHDDFFVDNMVAKMKEAAFSLSGDEYSQGDFEYDRKFYYNELTRELAD